MNAADIAIEDTITDIQESTRAKYQAYADARAAIEMFRKEQQTGVTMSQSEADMINTATDEQLLEHILSGMEFWAALTASELTDAQLSGIARAGLADMRREASALIGSRSVQ